MKIGHKLILSFLSLALLMGMVDFLSISVSEKALQNGIVETSLLLSHETLNKLERNIYERIEYFQSYSKNSILQKFVLESNHEFSKLNDVQDKIDQIDKEWRASPQEVTTPFMEKLIDNALSEDLRSHLDYFEKKYGFRVFGEVIVTNKYGANVAQTGKSSDYNQADEQWWQVAKEEGVYIRDVAYDTSARVYSTDIAVGINDASENFLGAIKIPLNIRGSVDILKGLEVAEKHDSHSRRNRLERTISHGIKCKLLTKDGRIIYSTEKFSLLKKMPSDIFSRVKKTLREGTKNYFIEKGDLPGEGNELFIYDQSSGYRDFKGLGWILLIEHDTQRIFAPINRLKRNLLYTLSFIMILAILLGLLISRSISLPIKKLTEGATKIGQGKFDTRVKIRSKNELGLLANVFNKMAGDLKSFMMREKNFIESEARIAAESKRAQEVSALNQQLRANEQQLRASNHQLKADEQQLKAANQQLKANERQLKVKNQQLKANEQILLKTEEALKHKLADLELFKEVAVDREITMINLKKEINELLKESGKEPKYEEIE